MRKIAYIGCNEVAFDTERPVTVVLVGQWDEEKIKPSEALVAERAHVFDKTKPKATDEQAEAIRIYMKQKSSGYFAPKALNWLETPEQAEADKANWPDRINFTTVPVQATIK